MTCIVKVIAHTKFIGVPTDLYPLDAARAAMQEKYDKAIQEGIEVNRPFSEYATPEVVEALAKEMVTAAGQDQGTDAERLVECAGRTCYDSYGKGRASVPYHEHIKEVDHGSVEEHATISFFISAVSRGLTHELVRHRVGVAISQRSTRYVDESASPWIEHPLLTAFRAANPGVPPFKLTIPDGHKASSVSELMGQDVYDPIVACLQTWLISRGTDKFTARKQARGAARGYLGNALQTELVWTVNIRALLGILKQRANSAADAEIRLFAVRLYEEALPYWPSYLGHLRKRDCPDGLGYELFDPESPKEKLAVLTKEAVRLRQIAKTFAAFHTTEATPLGALASEVYLSYPTIDPLFKADDHA